MIPRRFISHMERNLGRPLTATELEVVNRARAECETGKRDSVNCGGGADAVLADKVDIVAQDGLQQCERVRRKR